MAGINTKERLTSQGYETYVDFCKRLGITDKAKLKRARKLDR